MEWKETKDKQPNERKHKVSAVCYLNVNAFETCHASEQTNDWVNTHIRSCNTSTRKTVTHRHTHAHTTILYAVSKSVYDWVSIPLLHKSFLDPPLFFHSFSSSCVRYFFTLFFFLLHSVVVVVMCVVVNALNRLHRALYILRLNCTFIFKRCTDNPSVSTNIPSCSSTKSHSNNSTATLKLSSF